MALVIEDGIIRIRAQDDTAAGVAEARRRVSNIRESIKLDADIEGVRKGVRIAEAELRRLRAQPASVRVNADIAAAQAKLTQLRSQAQAMGRLREQLRIEANTAPARDNLARLSREAQNTSRNLRAIHGALGGMNFGSAARGIAIFSGLASAAGAAGAAIAAIPGAGAAAGSMIGVLAGSFSGVGDALKGYKADQDAATAATGKGAAAAVSSGRQIRDAQQAVTAARENAAQVAVEGAQRIEDAERAAARTAADGAEAVADAKEAQIETSRRGAEAVQDSSRRVQDALDAERDAQEDLTRAYEDAGRALDELREKVSDYALDQEGAAIRVIEAEDELRDTMANAGATALDRRKAEYELAVAKERVSDLTREQAQDTAALNDAERKGLAGSDLVIAAQGRLNDAMQATADARLDLRRTTEEAERANQDAAEATARAQRDAAEANADAARDVARAQADAAQANADASDQIQDALQGVEDAMASQAAQANDSAGATSKFADAMAKLSPAGRAFVEQLLRMQPLVKGLRDAAQESFLPGLTSMLRDSEGLFPIFQSHITRTGQIMGDAAVRMGELFRSDRFKANLSALLASSLPITQAISSGMVSMTDKIVEFGARMGPAADGFASFIDSVVSGFNGMLDNLAPHAESFRRIWEALGRIMEILLPLIGELVGWLADRLAPILEDLAGWLERNKDSLDEWAIAIGGAVLAIKGLNMAVSVAKWAQGISAAIGGIGRSADGAKGRLAGSGALKGALALGAVLGGAQILGGAIQDQNAPDAPWRKFDADQSGQLGTRERGRALMDGDLGGIGSIMSSDLQKSWAGGGEQWSKGNFGQAINSWLLSPEMAQKIAIAQDGIGIMLKAKWNTLKTDLGGIAASLGDGIASKFDSRGLSGWLSNAWTGISTNASMAWNGLWGSLSTTAQNIWGSVTGWFGRLWGDVTGWAGRTWSGVSGWWNRLWADVSLITGNLWGSVTGWFGRLWGDVTGWAGRLWGSVSGWWNRLWFDISTITGNLWGSVTGWFGRLWGDVTGWASRLWGSVTGWWNRLRGDIGNITGGLWSSVTGWFGRLWGDVTGWASRTWSGVTGWFRRMWDDVSRLGRDGINGVIRALNWLSDKGNVVLRFLHVPTIPGIPMLEAGGTLGPQMLASGGRVGGGFITDGPQAIVGEGNPNHPEYVIPTDPRYRGRAMTLFSNLAGQLGAGAGRGMPMLADGGILGWAGRAWGGITNFASSVGNKLSDAMSWIGDVGGSLSGEVLNAVRDMLPSEPFRGIGVGVAKSAFDGIKKMMENSFMSSADPGGAGVQRWAPLVLRALAMMGQPASLLNIVLRRMNQESGGNPNIVNNWDSNAKKGTPSGGLMQTILPTFLANHFPGTSYNMFDPLANVLASMKYALRRYGSLAAAYNRPGGYALGGVVPGVGRMDSVPIRTMPGERVLTRSQNDAFERLVATLEGRSVGAPVGLGDRPVEVNIHQVATSAAETGRFVALGLRTVR